MLTFKNLDQSLIGLSKLLLNKGVPRKTRGFDCIELPYPVMIKIKNPKDRLVTIKERKWNHMLAFAESLWIASGTNHMSLVGDYVKNMYTFSDDGEYMRAAYGPRIRKHMGVKTDYESNSPFREALGSATIGYVDQLKFVIEKLKIDPNSRQASMTIHEPAKDNFELDGGLKKTKDTPCCRTIQFLIVDGKLDCIVQFRSNDLIWGYSAVNVFNFTFMQEYVSLILGVPMGAYYHIANNLHYYADKQDMVEVFAALNMDDYSENRNTYEYERFQSLLDFDLSVSDLFSAEKFSRESKTSQGLFDLSNSFILDWATVFHNYWNKDTQPFYNDYLTKNLLK